MRIVFLLITVIYSIGYTGCEKQKVNTQTSSDFSGVITTNDDKGDFPILFALNELYGYLDKQLQVIVPPIYMRGFNYTDHGYASVYYDEKPDLRQGRILDKEGDIIFTNNASLLILFDDIITYRSENDGLYKVVKFRDNTIIANGMGMAVTNEEGGVILVNLHDGGRTFLDFSGKKILPGLELRMPSRGFQEGRAVITDGNYNIRIIDINGNFYGNLNFYRTGWGFSEGLLPAETKDGRTGYINKDGEFVFNVPFIADILGYQLARLMATDFKGGYALIQTVFDPPTWRVIDNQGNFVSEELYLSWANAFTDGLSCVTTIDAGYGYINTKGEMAIAPIFDYADSFHKGYARIIYKGRDGIINTEGQIFWSDEIVKNK